MTALIACVDQELIKPLTHLLSKKNLNPNAQHKTKDTALHLATTKHNIDIVTMLLEHRKTNKVNTHTRTIFLISLDFIYRILPVKIVRGLRYI